MVEEVVTDQHGEEAWEDVLGSAGLAGAYTSLGTYPDDDLSRIVCAGSAALSTPEDALLRDLGRCSLAKLAVRYPGFFAPYTATRPFLLGLNDVIHAEVRKLYPDAEVPHFTIDDSCPDAVGLGYDSPLRLCASATSPRASSTVRQITSASTPSSKGPTLELA
ncbi:hypothetical protein BH23ACT2_BH23ACT2_00230 [soil metagenome]